MSKVLQDLEKSRRVIRKKYQKLRRLQGLAQQEVTRTLEPLIKPLQNLVSQEIKQEPNVERAVKPELWEPEQSVGGAETAKDDDESSGDFSDATAVATLEDSGGVLTSTPKPPPKPLFTHGISSLLDPADKRPEVSNTLGARYWRELYAKVDNDLAYGPKLDVTGRKWMLGRLPLEVNGDTIRLGEREFPGTLGLFELIFKSHPRDVEEDDLKTYAKIMQHTGLHLNKLNKVKANKGVKYKNIIARLAGVPVQDVEDNPDTTIGGQLQLQHTEAPVRYVFWDDPNELVERLELLVGERDAGHTGLDNEILSILEELRERGLVINSERPRLYPAF